MKRTCKTCRYHDPSLDCPDGSPSCGGVNDYYKWRPKEGNMKYKIIEAISAKTILDKHPCEDGYVEYVKKFGIDELMGYNTDAFISWAEKHGHISWLIDKGFIERVENDIECIWCHAKNEHRLTVQKGISKVRRSCVRVICSVCGARSMWYDSEKKAIDAWNAKR